MRDREDSGSRCWMTDDAIGLYRLMWTIPVQGDSLGLILVLFRWWQEWQKTEVCLIPAKADFVDRTSDSFC